MSTFVDKPYFAADLATDCSAFAVTNSTHSQSYIYKDLHLDSEAFSTRLLTILPGQDSEPIRCKLKVTAINACTVYEALSYTWGKETPTHNILINGKPFDVRINLSEALRVLRLPKKRRRVWIDAICINQEDLDERAAQIKLMGQIFRNANQVLIWLGKGTDYTEAMRCTKEHQKHVWYERGVNFSKEGIYDLLKHAWFSRVWVVQELCMASGDPLILCGNLKLPWSSLVQFAKSSRPTLGQVEHVLEMNKMRSRTQQPPRMRNFDNPLQGASGLLEDDLSWFRCTTMFEATDPRDKLYALLGLTRGPLGKSIKIDYTVSAEFLMKEVMIHQAETHKNLDLLTLCRNDSLSTRRQGSTWIPKLFEQGLQYLPVIKSEGPEQAESGIPSFRKSSVDPFAYEIEQYRFSVSEASTKVNFCVVINEGSKLAARGCSLGRVAAVLRDVVDEWEQFSEGYYMAMARNRDHRALAQGQNDWHKLSNQDGVPGLGGDLRHSIRRMNQAYQYTAWAMHRDTLKKCDDILSDSKLGLIVQPTCTAELNSENIGRQVELVRQRKNELQTESSRLRHMVDAGESRLWSALNKASERVRVVEEYEAFLDCATACAVLDFHWRPLTSKLLLDGRMTDYVGEDGICKLQFRLYGLEWIRIECGFLTASMPAMYGRYQFVTDTGLIGIGPCDIKETDKIVMFHASSFGYALRDTKAGEQELIGQVLVCPPPPIHEYPTKEWIASRPTNYPTNWKPLAKEDFVLR